LLLKCPCKHEAAVFKRSEDATFSQNQVTYFDWLVLYVAPHEEAALLKKILVTTTVFLTVKFKAGMNDDEVNLQVGHFKFFKSMVHGSIPWFEDSRGRIFNLTTRATRRVCNKIAQNVD
jgi:hypothetical protein